MIAIWGAIGVITILAIGSLAWPVLRQRQTAPARRDYDLTVFQDQLKELERDLARGVLTPEEASAARLEIQRRILSVSRAPVETRVAASMRSRWVMAGITAVAVPVIAIGIYTQVGTPDPELAQQVALETQGGMSQSDIDALVDRLAARVASEPDNPDGVALLARTYRELGRFNKAADAYRRLVKLEPNAETYSSLGEALTMTQNGRVTPEAHTALMTALTFDRSDPRARFYLGLEQAAEGKARNAIAIWRDLTANAPSDAPWADMVRAQISALAQNENIAPITVEPKHPLDLLPKDETAMATANNAPQAAPSAAAGMSPENTKMIRDMVAGLAERLEQNPDDYDGWMMLGRSYTVLQDPEKSAAAYKKASDLRPKDVTSRLRYAGVLMMGIDPNAQTPFPPELSTAVKEVLALNSEQPEALYLAGLGAARTGDTANARVYWEHAQKVAAEGSALRKEIDRRLNLLK